MPIRLHVQGACRAKHGVGPRGCRTDHGPRLRHADGDPAGRWTRQSKRRRARWRVQEAWEWRVGKAWAGCWLPVQTDPQHTYAGPCERRSFIQTRRRPCPLPLGSASTLHPYMRPASHSLQNSSSHPDTRCRAAQRSGSFPTLLPGGVLERKESKMNSHSPREPRVGGLEVHRGVGLFVHEGQPWCQCYCCP